jgi:hypothetical protein
MGGLERRKQPERYAKWRSKIVNNLSKVIIIDKLEKTFNPS